MAKRTYVRGHFREYHDRDDDEIITRRRKNTALENFSENVIDIGDWD